MSSVVRESSSGKSLRANTSNLIPARPALLRAKASARLDMTREISVPGRLPLLALSMRACRLVPPPETKTAILTILSTGDTSFIDWIGDKVQFII